MSDYYITTGGELYHYGVKGMKWGVRRYHNEDGSLTDAGRKRQTYADSKKELKTARKNYKKANRGLGMGIKAIQRSEQAKSPLQKAYVDNVNARAEYKKSTAKNSKAAEKAEFKSYVKSMYKTGIRGSAKDVASLNVSTELYNSIQAKKGKEYADRVEKKVQNKAIKGLAGAAIVTVGSAIVASMIDY